jgi:glycine reductase
MNRKLKVVHYLNQFFGQIGGEDKADVGPLKKDGAVGPGLLFQQIFGREAEITGTVICGDNYFNEHMETAKEEVLALIEGYGSDLVLAGPAFNAGRYGTACGAICEAVTVHLGIPTVTGMFSENPGVDLYRKSIHIIETKPSSMGMKDAARNMVALAMKLARGEPLGSPKEEGYIPKGFRRNTFTTERGATRAVEMLLQKIKGHPFETEYPMPVFDRVDPLPPPKHLRDVSLALITSGGIFPKGNPDQVESSNATKYGKYSIRGVDRLNPETYEAVHGGYDPTDANDDPHRVLPLDVVRDLEREGVIGEIYPYYYATVGNGTSVANAKAFARKIAVDLVRDGVKAVIISST